MLTGVAELTAVFGGHRVTGRVTVLPAGTDVAGTYMLTITAGTTVAWVLALEMYLKRRGSAFTRPTRDK
jgi:hypothetical protein